MVAKLEQARWWAIRPVRSRKPATYRCPLCGLRLHAMSDHVLISPEGDGDRRRHAHRECVLAAREAGAAAAGERVAGHPAAAAVALAEAAAQTLKWLR